jgi:hypothetical protein
MKTNTKTLIIGLLTLFGTNVSSAADISNLSLAHINSIALQPQYLIEWKVGDTLNYDISISVMGKMGTSTRTVTKDEGDSLWISETMSLSGRQEVVEAQIDKNTGQVLKIIRNGKVETAPNDPLDIISQDYTSVTVPAGTFDCLHVVAKSKSIKNIEVWANPQAVVMDGSVKTVVTANQMPLPITMVLTSFQRGN